MNPTNKTKKQISLNDLELVEKDLEDINNVEEQEEEEEEETNYLFSNFINNSNFAYTKPTLEIEKKSDVTDHTHSLTFKVSNHDIVYKSECFLRILKKFLEKNNHFVLGLNKIVRDYIKNYIDRINLIDSSIRTSEKLREIMMLCMKFSGLEIFDEIFTIKVTENDELFVTIDSLLKSEVIFVYLLFINALNKFGFRLKLTDFKNKAIFDTLYEYDYKSTMECRFKVLNDEDSNGKSSFFNRVYSAKDSRQIINEFKVHNKERLKGFLKCLMDYNEDNINHEKYRNIEPDYLEMKITDNVDYVCNTDVSHYGYIHFDMILKSYFGISVLLNNVNKGFSIFRGIGALKIAYTINKSELGIKVYSLNFSK